MLTPENMKKLKEQLVKEGYERLKSPASFIDFTTVHDADILLNDLAGHPYAFVIGCIMDRQIKAEKAWIIPYELKQRLGFIDFSQLAKLEETSPGKIDEAMLQPTPLHRYSNVMTEILHDAIQRINKVYSGNAGAIWADRPASAKIVQRFREFRGVGQKISNMAANILIRDFRVEVSERCSVDISLDIHVTRVFTRMGFVPPNSTAEFIFSRARELHPNYPGIFDLILWEHGRNVCKSRPLCGECRFNSLCDYANSANES